MSGGRCGTRYWYIHGGCRCDDCKAANREWQKKANRDRAARLKQDPSLAPHGKWTTYSNWMCRCDECKAAAVIVNAAGNARRKRAAA